MRLPHLLPRAPAHSAGGCASRGRTSSSSLRTLTCRGAARRGGELVAQLWCAQLVRALCSVFPASPTRGQAALRAQGGARRSLRPGHPGCLARVKACNICACSLSCRFVFASTFTVLVGCALFPLQGHSVGDLHPAVRGMAPWRAGPGGGVKQHAPQLLCTFCFLLLRNNLLLLYRVAC